MKPLLPLAIALALSGCVSYHTASDGLVRAGLGESAALPNGARVTPLQVLEDSRCPAGVQCVWAGQVRLSVRIDRNGTSSAAELVSRKPMALADGTIELVEVAPAKRKDAAIYPEDYRFGFAFTRRP